MCDVAASGQLLRRFVERANSLYTLPAVAVEVLELTEQPAVDIPALKLCVERDPGLTAKLLRVVNSSMFGLSREVTDLNQALALLGVKPLKLLVLGFCLPKALFEGLEAETLHAFWRHSLVKAVAARELCRVFWRGPHDEAFVAALLQDIGVLVLIQELGGPYVDFLRSVREEGRELSAMEHETLGFDHAILSARLLDHWNLPASIVRAVSAPRDQEGIAGLDAGDQPMAQILHLAALIAAIVADGCRQVMPDLLNSAARYGGITVDQIVGLLDEMQERVELMASTFCVPATERRSYREILEQAHRQMSDAALLALPDMLRRADKSASLEAGQRVLGDVVKRFTLHPADAAPGTERVPAHAAHPVPGPAACVPVAAASGAAASGAAAASVRQRFARAGDPGVLGRLQSAIVSCCHQRAELSLMLVEIDDFDRLLVAHGLERMMQISRLLPGAIEKQCELPCDCVQASDERCAVILPRCDRQQGVALARTVIDRVPAWLLAHGATSVPIQCSAGVATLAVPSRGSRAEELLAAAERCLFAARSSGSRVVKSIDVF